MLKKIFLIYFEMSYIFNAHENHVVKFALLPRILCQVNKIIQFICYKNLRYSAIYNVNAITAYQYKIYKINFTAFIMVLRQMYDLVFVAVVQILQ